MFREIRKFVKKIPKGKVATYGQVAEAAGFPRGSRQVAWSLKTFDPTLPWQRVIGKVTAKRGKILLRGMNGAEQAQRLESEGVRVEGIYVDLLRFGHVFKGGGRSLRSPAKSGTARKTSGRGERA